MTTLAFAAALPAVCTYLSLLESTSVGARVMPRAVRSLNRVRYALPLLVFAIVALSSPTHRDAPETASTDGPNEFLELWRPDLRPEGSDAVNLHFYGTWEEGKPLSTSSRPHAHALARSQPPDQLALPWPSDTTRLDNVTTAAKAFPLSTPPLIQVPLQAARTTAKPREHSRLRRDLW